MRSVELFSGAGGLGLGLHASGFKPVAVIERDPYCCETIRENSVRGQKAVKHWKLFETDVREIDFKQFEGRVDLVSGGPPCQPFSLGGKHAAYDDTRDMFPQAIRAVRQSKPRAFVFENVKGLTRSAFRNYFEYIRLQLSHPSIVLKKGEVWRDHLARLQQHHTSGSRSGLNYRVVTHLANAADYGVPQRRERVFFVGFREDLGVRWHFPKPTHSKAALLAVQSTGEYWERHSVAPSLRPKCHSTMPLMIDEGEPKELPWVTVRDAISDLPDPRSVGADSILNHRFQPGAKSYPGHTGSALDEPAKTLKAGVHGVPGGENMLVNLDGAVRYFTVRESARLQTFPDDFLFHGSWSETMRQLGNAVPVRLAEVVGRDVARHLK